MLYSIEWNISQGTNAKRDQKTYFGINQTSNNVTKKTSKSFVVYFNRRKKWSQELLGIHWTIQTETLMQYSSQGRVKLRMGVLPFYGRILLKSRSWLSRIFRGYLKDPKKPTYGVFLYSLCSAINQQY